MQKNKRKFTPELVYGSSDSIVSRRISNEVKKGNLKKIACRLYTSNLEEPFEGIVKRNIFPIISNLYPGAVLSHRSAFEFEPSKEGRLYLTYKYAKKIELPGITLCLLEGQKAIKGDHVFSGELMVSQRERAFLENLQISKGRFSKTLSISEIEEKLEKVIQVNGVEALKQLRDKAKQIAQELAMNKEYKRLNKIIGAILNPELIGALKSPLAKARALGMPYDVNRLDLFQQLFKVLKNEEFKLVEDKNHLLSDYKKFAFFESYFSNYIEGTIFKLSDAKRIIDTREPMVLKQEDSQDILGTYDIVANKQEMNITPYSAEDFLDILQYRHAILLSSRENKLPGKFKTMDNRVGNTFFVSKELVRGTLIKSFDFYRVLEQPFAKALYIAFVVSEVHPFLDGNGRLSRIMLNAELSSKNQVKIIIPTVYREDYLGAVRRLSRNGDPKTYIKMFKRAQAFSATLVGDRMEAILNNSNAFKESNQGVLKIVLEEMSSYSRDG